MCDCNKELLKHLEARLIHLREDINSRRTTDSGKDVTENLEGRSSQISEVIYAIRWLQNGKKMKDL
tara:strand:+ start:584 stop:781 length:198 start_codon:yes stop_codon:yes gene_type:complete